MMVTSEIVPYFHEFTVLLPINKTGDKLLSQSCVVLVHLLENVRVFTSALGLKVLNLPVRIVLHVLFRGLRFFLSVF